MAQQDIIREFLVSLGFKVDERGLKNFQGGVEEATKAVAGMVAGIEAAALVVGGLVVSFAQNIENLYFQSQRVGSSVSDLKAFGNAAKNMGVETGEALGNIESLAAALRNNPGNEGFLNALGVKTRDANGNLRESVDMMLDLGKAFQGMEPYLRKLNTDQLGISERMVLAISDPRFAAEMEKQRDLLKGSGMDKAAQDAHEFEIKLRSLQTRIESVGTVIANSLLDALGPQMEKASEWFERNGKRITEVLTLFSTAIVNMGAIVLPILDKIAEGWRLIFNLVKDTGAEINKVLPQTWKDKIGKWTNSAFEGLGIADAVYDMATGTTPTGGGRSKTPATAEGIMGRLMQWGWTREQAAGIAANLFHESGFDATATGDGGQAYGLAQWHPDRQAAFAKFAGHDIRNSTLDEQLAFMNYELTNGAERQAGALMRAATNSRQASDIMTMQYERPANAELKAMERGATAMQYSQNTTINVNGSGDPAAVGRSVADEQQRVGADAIRNMQSKVQ